MSRFGKPVVQIGKPDELDEDEKPKYANLGPGHSLENIDLEEGLKLFQLPKTLGEYEGQPVSVHTGRYGPYVKFGDAFISLAKGEDPFSVNMDRAKELIQEKKKADAPIGSYKGFPITKGKGRFGPFLKWDKLYVNIPRKFDPETISLEDAHQLIEAKIEKEANRYIHQWTDEGISVENGRWGPFIRFKKKNIKMGKIDGKKVTSEMAAELTLDQVKTMIEAEVPNAFKKKKSKA